MSQSVGEDVDYSPALRHGHPGYVPAPDQSAAPPGHTIVLSTSLYVGFGKDTAPDKREDVLNLFAHYGKIVNVMVYPGFAFVRMNTRKSAETALQTANFFEGRRLLMSWTSGTLPKDSLDKKYGTMTVPSHAISNAQLFDSQGNYINNDK